MTSKINKLINTHFKYVGQFEKHQEKQKLFKAKFYKKINNLVLKKLFNELSKEFIIESNTNSFYVLLSQNPRIVIFSLHTDIKENLKDNPTSYIKNLEVHLHPIHLKEDSDLQKILKINIFYKKFFNNKTLLIDSLNKYYYNYYQDLQNFQKTHQDIAQKISNTKNKLVETSYNLLKKRVFTKNPVILKKFNGERYCLNYKGIQINNILEFKLLEILDTQECILEFTALSSSKNPYIYKLKAHSFDDLFEKDLGNSTFFLT